MINRYCFFKSEFKKKKNEKRSGKKPTKSQSVNCVNERASGIITIISYNIYEQQSTHMCFIDHYLFVNRSEVKK